MLEACYDEIKADLSIDDFQKMPTQLQLDRNLLLAAKTGDELIARVSLRDGADPNYLDDELSDLFGERPSYPLLLAVGNGHTTIVKMLLEAGAKLPEKEWAVKHLSRAAKYAECSESLLLLFQIGLPPTRADAEWAEEFGHIAVKDFVLDRLGAYSINYDIDELLQLDPHSFYGAFAEKVPDPYSTHDNMLYPEERVLRDVWEFEFSTGSGFSALLSNERFDVITRSHPALLALGNSNASSAISEVWALFQEYGVLKEMERSDEDYISLPDEFWEEIDGIDQVYFGAPNETNIWAERAHLNLGIEYAKQHSEILRKRKTKQ